MSHDVVGDDFGVTVADDELARIGSVLDDWDREDPGLPERDPLPDAAEQAFVLVEALGPIIGVTIKLGVGPAPGAAPEEDARWAALVALARRDVVARRNAGIDHGLAATNLRLLERVDALIGTRDDPGWDRLVRDRVSELVDARKRGRQRGIELGRLRESSASPDPQPVGWLLRHPTDYWLRQAAPTVADVECRTLIETQIELLAPNYQELCELDWSTEEAAAQIVCDVAVLYAKQGASAEAMRATVMAACKGDVKIHQQVALRAVEDPDGPFNGKLMSVLAGERWRICADYLEDGALLPLDGTRRLGVA